MDTNSTSLDIINFRKYMYSNYSKYLSTFIPIYLNLLTKEYSALLENFPYVSFETLARIKNPSSYFEKGSSKPDNYTFSDIYANKYIINSVNNSKDEKILSKTCYEFSNFLTIYNLHNENNLTEFTDYITNPKRNSYSSLHLKFQNSSIQDFRFETQIKTEKMRWNEKFGEASHTQNYKKRHNVTLDILPIFIKPFYNSNGVLEFKLQDRKSSFKEYYGFSYEDYLKNEER